MRVHIERKVIRSRERSQNSGLFFEQEITEETEGLRFLCFLLFDSEGVTGEEQGRLDRFRSSNASCRGSLPPTSFVFAVLGVFALKTKCVVRPQNKQIRVRDTRSAIVVADGVSDTVISAGEKRQTAPRMSAVYRARR